MGGILRIACLSAVAVTTALSTALAVAAAPDAPASPAAPSASVFEAREKAFGVSCRALLYTTDRAGAQTATAAAFAEIKRIEALFSTGQKDADIVHLNQTSGGSAVTVADDTLEALRLGKSLSASTQGAFALTAAPVTALWHFADSGAAATALPEASLIEARLGLVDDQSLMLDAAAHTAKLVRKGMAVSLEAIAKGYAVDRTTSLLTASGFPNALISIGGTIRASGTKQDKSWRIGIQDPRAESYFALVPLQNQAAATVGDYQRYFDLDGQRYSDRIDPRSGFPTQGLRSVTVLASDAVSAEALSAAVFVLSAKQGMAWVEAQPGVQTIMVDSQNEVLISTGLKDLIKILRAPTP